MTCEMGCNVCYGGMGADHIGQCCKGMSCVTDDDSFQYPVIFSRYGYEDWRRAQEDRLKALNGRDELLRGMREAEIARVQRQVEDRRKAEKKAARMKDLEARNVLPVEVVKAAEAVPERVKKRAR